MPSTIPGAEPPIRPPPSWARATIEPMAGDASTRRFYRLRDPRRRHGAVLMVYEGASARADIELFREVAGFFRTAGVRVPAIYEASPAGGYLVVEDLGDTTLSRRLRETPTADACLYAEALDILGSLQRARCSSGPIAARRLDAELFRRELDHTMRWLVDTEPGLAAGADRREDLAVEAARLASAIQEQPLVICHRDYHSRNILCTPAGLALVDFQDARLGPYTYDLASLAHDPYVDLSEPQSQSLRGWLTTRSVAGRSPIGIERDLDHAVLQRSLKAAGTYAYQDRACGRSGYRGSIPVALGHAAAAARRLGDFPALEDLIDRCRTHLC